MNDDAPPAAKSPSRERRVVLGLLWAIAAISLILFLRQAFLPGRSTDLGFLWAAGRMWNMGLDPYGAGYQAFGKSLFADATDWRFVYPPQWYGLARLIALVPFHQAVIIWRLFNMLAVLAAAFLLCRASLMLPRPAPIEHRLLFVAVLLSGETIGAVLSIGQTSLLVLLGMALLIYGTMRENAPSAVLGLFIIMLKPNIGLPIVLISLLTRRTRRQLLFAIVASGAACLPLLAAGPSKMIGIERELLGNIGAYNGAAGFNAPGRMTGLIHFLPSLSPIAVCLFAGALACAALWRERARGDACTARVGIWLYPIAIVAALVPLHNYDLAFVAIPILLLHLMRLGSQAPLLVGILIIQSARRLTHLMPATTDLIARQAEIASVGSWLMLLGAVMTLIFGWRRNEGQQELPLLPVCGPVFRHLVCPVILRRAWKLVALKPRA